MIRSARKNSSCSNRWLFSTPHPLLGTYLLMVPLSLSCFRSRACFTGCNGVVPGITGIAAHGSAVPAGACTGVATGTPVSAGMGSAAAGAAALSAGTMNAPGGGDAIAGVGAGASGWGGGCTGGCPDGSGGGHASGSGGGNASGGGTSSDAILCNYVCGTNVIEGKRQWTRDTLQ